MKVLDLTKEQIDMICDYVFDKYAMRKRGFIQNVFELCKHCPCGVPGENDVWVCGASLIQENPELNPEFEELIKKNH